MADVAWIQLSMVQLDPQWTQLAGEPPPPPPGEFTPGVVNLAARVKMMSGA